MVGRKEGRGRTSYFLCQHWQEGYVMITFSSPLRKASQSVSKLVVSQLWESTFVFTVLVS